MTLCPCGREGVRDRGVCRRCLHKQIRKWKHLHRRFLDLKTVPTYTKEFEDTRTWFLELARKRLGDERFERISGALYLKCRSTIVTLLETSEEYMQFVAWRSIKQLVRQIETAEEDFFNRSTPTRSIKVEGGLYF